MPATKPGIGGRLSCIAAGISALLLSACSPLEDDMDSPPETTYTQAEAYAPMEEAAADVVAVLPDFPGFEKRVWTELPCNHDGKDDPDYTSIEIHYSMSIEDSGTAPAREEYVEVLREHWTGLGYEVTYDETDELANGRTDRNLAAKREDGITLWYRVWGVVGLVIQSGCVPVSEVSEFEYIPPAGGIEPGGDMDRVEEYFPDGIPTDQAASIDPFAGTRAAAGPIPFDSPDSYEGQI
jgi:hypothetical protein